MMNEPRPAPDFIAGIHNSLRYWLSKAEPENDDTIRRLDQERHNLHRSLWHGVRLAETWRPAVELLLKTFALAERRGYWSEWLQLIEQALQMSELGDVPHHVRLLNRQGQFYRMQWNLSRAVEVHETAVSLARSHADPMLLAEARWSLIVDQILLGEYELALVKGQELLDFFRNNEVSSWWLVQMLRPLGTTAKHLRKFELAETYLTEAVDLARTLSEPRTLALALNDLALALQESDRPQEALACFQEAAELLAPTIYIFDKAMTDLNLGTLHFRLGRLEEAATAFRRAAESGLRQSGHVYFRAALENNLGNVLFKQGKYAEAKAALERALQLMPQIGDEARWGDTLGMFAMVLAKLNDCANAARHFQEAIQLLSKKQDDQWAQKQLERYKAAYLELPEECAGE